MKEQTHRPPLKSHLATPARSSNYIEIPKDYPDIVMVVLKYMDDNNKYIDATKIL